MSQRNFIILIIILVLFAVCRGEKQTDTPTPHSIQPLQVQQSEQESITLTSKKPSNIFVVKKVIDGDTILASNDTSEIKIRLASIDAPETTQIYGKEATNHLSELICDKEITIDDYGIDRYNRTIATVYLENEDINGKMVEDGYAWFYPLYANGKDYLKQEITAREESRGQWKYNKGLIPPAIYRKLKTLGEFGKSLYEYGFYLDRNNILHNKLCPGYMYPAYRWDGYSPYTNCEKCGGCFVEGN